MIMVMICGVQNEVKVHLDQKKVHILLLFFYSFSSFFSIIFSFSEVVCGPTIAMIMIFDIQNKDEVMLIRN